MSVTSKIFAAAVALTLTGGVSVAVGTTGTLPASAATSACGSACADFFNVPHGPAANPALLLNVQGAGSGRLGQPVDLARASSANPGEDFVVNNVDTVSDYYLSGYAAGGLALRYGCLAGSAPQDDFKTCPAGSVDDYAFQIVYAPGGEIPPAYDCVSPSFSSTPSDGTPVVLEPCGVSSHDLWIFNPVRTAGGCEFTLISAATDSSFSDPYVLTSGYAGLFTFSLMSFAKTVLGNQLWGVDTGAVPDPTQVTSCSALAFGY